MRHVTAHAGDCFKEFVDSAAKREAQQSYNLPRQRLDMPTWIPKLRQLWTLFGSQIGLPSWAHGGLDVQAPDLPDSAPPRPVKNCYTGKSRSFQFTLSLASANVQSLYRGGDGHAGKLHYLQEQMKSFHLNCMALQETRSEAGFFANDTILRFCSGHRAHQLGIEIWINLTVPYAVDHKGKPMFFRAAHFQVVCHDERRLLLRCDTGIWSCWLLALHAPHTGHSVVERRQWWQDLRQELEKHYDSDTLFVLADANATPGDQDECTVLHGHFPHNGNTADWRSFLAAYELCLPSTSSVHEGSCNTWTHCDGLSEHCLDYVAVPRSCLGACTHSRVLEDFDLATPNLDHKAVALQLQWQAALPEFHHPGGHMQSPIAYVPHAALTDALSALPCSSWNADVEVQSTRLVSDLRQLLISVGRNAQKQVKKCYVTPEIWELRTRKLQLRKRIQLGHRQRRQALLHLLFEVWKSPVAQGHACELDVQTAGTRIHEAARYWHVCRLLRSALRQSKRIELRRQLETLPTGATASDVLKTLKAFTGPTNPKKRKQKALPFIRDEQGAVCQLPGEALGVWIRFFQEMEAGTQRLRQQWIEELRDFRQTELETDLADIPSLIDLECALRRSPQWQGARP